MDLVFLTNTTLFRGTSPQEAREMLACLGAYEHQYGKGDTILHIGECVENMGLVLSGGVAYNHAESCNSIITLYLSAAYPIVLLFDLLAVRGAVTTLRSASRIRKKTGE